MDPLEDVRLEGRTLVSDSPDEWVIPRSMSSASSLFEWWDQVIDFPEDWDQLSGRK